jgi:hypothetical protein
MREKSYLKRILYNIWPTVRNITNDILFLIIKVLRTIVNTALKQIK